MRYVAVSRCAWRRAAQRRARGGGAGVWYGSGAGLASVAWEVGSGLPFACSVTGCTCDGSRDCSGGVSSCRATVDVRAETSVDSGGVGSAGGVCAIGILSSGAPSSSARATCAFLCEPVTSCRPLVMYAVTMNVTANPITMVCHEDQSRLSKKEDCLDGTYKTQQSSSQPHQP